MGECFAARLHSLGEHSSTKRGNFQKCKSPPFLKLLPTCQQSHPIATIHGKRLCLETGPQKAAKPLTHNPRKWSKGHSSAYFWGLCKTCPTFQKQGPDCQGALDGRMTLGASFTSILLGKWGYHYGTHITLDPISLCTPFHLRKSLGSRSFWVIVEGHVCFLLCQKPTTNQP